MTDLLLQIKEQADAYIREHVTVTIGAFYGNFGKKLDEEETFNFDVTVVNEGRILLKNVALIVKSTNEEIVAVRPHNKHMSLFNNFINLETGNPYASLITFPVVEGVKFIAPQGHPWRFLRAGENPAPMSFTARTKDIIGNVEAEIKAWISADIDQGFIFGGNNRISKKASTRIELTD